MDVLDKYRPLTTWQSQFKVKIGNQVCQLEDTIEEKNIVTIHKGVVAKIISIYFELAEKVANCPRLRYSEVIVQNCCYTRNFCMPSHLHVKLKSSTAGSKNDAESEELVNIRDISSNQLQRNWIQIECLESFHWCDNLDFSPPKHNGTGILKSWSFSDEPSEFLLKNIIASETPDDNTGSCDVDTKIPCKNDINNDKILYSQRKLIVFNINGVISKIKIEEKKNMDQHNDEEYYIFIRPDLMKIIKLLEEQFDFAVYTSMERKKAERILDSIANVNESYRKLYICNDDTRLLSDEDCVKYCQILKKKVVCKIPEKLRDSNGLRYHAENIMMVDSNEDKFNGNEDNVIIFSSLQIGNHEHNKLICDVQYRFLQRILYEIKNDENAGNHQHLSIFINSLLLTEFPNYVSSLKRYRSEYSCARGVIRSKKINKTTL